MINKEGILLSYYREIVRSITNKKSLKLIIASMEQKYEEDDIKSYLFLTAFLEEIPWETVFENLNNVDPNLMVRINYLAKKIESFAEMENFVDYFPVVFLKARSSTLILKNLNIFMQILKLHQKSEIILATSFAFYPDNSELKTEGINLLAKQLKEFLLMGKPLDFPRNFVIFFTHFVKTNPENFKTLRNEINFFFETCLLPLKNTKTRATLSIGEPLISLGDMCSYKEDYSNEYVKYLHMSVTLESVLRELGPACSNSKEEILDILKSFPKIDETDLFNSLIMMLKSNFDTIVRNKNKIENNVSVAYVTLNFLNGESFDCDNKLKESTEKKNHKEWHIELFVKTVKGFYHKKLDWLQVFKSFITIKDQIFKDYEDKEYFKRFFLFMKFIREEIDINFSEILYSRWKRAENQCIFLYYILETNNVNSTGLKGSLDNKRNLTAENVNANLKTKIIEITPLWFNKDLLRLLINLSVKCGYYKKTKKLIESELTKNFEGIFFLLISLKCSSGNRLMNDLLQNAVNTILNSSSTLSELIEIFFQIDHNYLTYILVKVCEGDNNFIFLSKILDYSQTIKDFFMPLTETEYDYFSISLSLLAVKREFLRLENWVEGRLHSNSLQWVEEFIKYVYKKILNPLENYTNLNKKYVEEVLDKSQITINSLAIIFENFLLNDRHNSHIPEFIMEKIRTFYQKIQTYLPELTQVCTNEPEKKANQLLEELYFQNTSMDDFIQKIKSLKASNSNRDQELLSCVIINIIDELRFYQNFPEKELYITSDIFGKFIENSIIDGKVMVVFLKALSDSLENEGKMFNFGLKAIQHFIYKTNLNISPEFYKLLFGNEKLRTDHFELLYKLEKKLKETKKLNGIPQEYLNDVNNRMKNYIEKNKPQETTPIKKDKKLPSTVSKYPEKNLMDFLKNKYKLIIKNLKIEKKKKEKIIFWMNSIEDKKLELKIQEFQKLLDSVNTILWFSIYLVYKRVPYEPSMQNIYRKLIIRSHIKVLYYEVYKRSMKMINQLIDYVMNKKDLLTEEQNISRHCGKWIGYITLVCNRPILLKDFDIKLKIYNAIKEEKLSNIIPIICTTLLMTKKSTFFNSKIPFINALFDILREIMTIQWIPSSIKVYIEVLFNELKIKIKDLHRFNFISKKKASSNKGNEKNMFFIKSLRDYVKIDLSGISEKEIQKKSGVDLKQIVALAIDQSIKDIIRPVLDRSVSNTLETTREIAIKDYQGEPDEKKFMEGAEAMITNLTWNLALVTCREPLRSQINQHLNTYLETQTEFDDITRKNLTVTLSQSNLDIACNIVKKIVINDALDSIKKDKFINSELELRRQAKTNGNVYVNPNYDWLKKNLPKEFNPETAYQELNKIEIYGTMEENAQKESLPKGSGTMFVVPPTNNPKQNLEEQKIKELFELLEKEIENPNNIEKMRKIHGIYSSLSKILQSTKNIENQIFDLAKYVLEKLFFTPKISMECLKHFSDVLIIYSNINPKLPKKITEWIFSLKNETFKHPLISVFLRRNLLHLKEFDNLFSIVLSEKNVIALNCIVQVMKSLVIEEKIFSIHSFPKILIEITKIGKTEILNDVSIEVSIFIRNLIDYIENQNKINSLMFRLTNLEPEYKKLFNDVSDYFKQLHEDIYTQVCQCLQDWFKAENEEEMQKIIKDFDEKIIDKDEKSLIIFFCYLFEISVNKALNIVSKNKIQKLENLDYTYIDAVSKFITILLKSSKDATFFFEKILTSLIIVLTKKHSTDNDQEEFNQKPFFKILFNIIYDINRSEYDFKDQLDKFSVVLVQTLHILQPIKYPGFAFAWLQLISSKFLLKTILRENNHEIWTHYTILLVDLMIFYKDVFSIDFVVKEEMKLFYKGTLRILLVLIHDFSDFLSEQSFIILEEIPPHFKQFRNIILSAYPKNLKIQNPFNKPNQKSSILNEYQELPHLSPKIEARINSHDLHSILINYIKKPDSSKQDSEEINHILERFYIIGYKEDVQINVPLLESFVVYVPYFLYSNLNQNQNKNNFNVYIDQSFTLFMKILEWEDYELREVVINAILNNLRYPNDITFYFISLILIIFTEMKINNLYEQIIKNLLERLIIEKPHPWGILSLVYQILTNKFFEEKKFYKENEKFVDDLVKIAFKYAKINNNNTTE